MKKGVLGKVLLLVLAACIGGFISLGLYKAFENDDAVRTSEVKKTPVANYEVKNIELPTFDFTEIAKVVNPSVVHIRTVVSGKGSGSQGGSFDFFDDILPPEYYQPRMGSGSGVIVSGDGYIVTNYHVIRNAGEIKVMLHDNRHFDAKLVGKDPYTDLALLKIDAQDLPKLKIGNSDQVEVGEWVIAVGNPFNLTSTVTAGIVSAKARNINLYRGGKHIESFIQTDAAVNPGNSGGALVNVKGKLIGINTAIASKTGEYAGYAFAIPSDIVEKVVEDLKEFGEVKRGYIGVSIAPVTEEVANDNDLEKISGAWVREVMEVGAAAKAGLQKGDIIIKVNEKRIESVPELQEIIGLHRPGDEVTLTIVRDGETLHKKVVLKSEFGSTKLVDREEDKLRKKLGAKFSTASSRDKQKLDIDHGVKVLEVKEGKFEEIGIPEGFIITTVNNQPVYKPGDLYNLIQDSKGGGILLEGVHQDGSKGYYGFGMG